MNRTDVAVCIVGAGTDTGGKVRAQTPDDVPVLTVDTETEAFERAAPGDVVLLRPGCRVAPGWLESLREAAYASATTATATALTQHDLDRAPADLFEPAAAEVRAGSLRVRPRIESPGDAACVYVRRSALDLVGGLGTGGEDFRTGCAEVGLAHVLADDVLVFDPSPSPPRAEASSAPVSRAKNAARRAVRGLSATIDASILSGPTTGTHVHVLELIAGLARTEQVRLSAIVPDQPSEHALSRLRAVPRVDLLTYREASRAAAADIVHRPFQLSNAGELTFVESLGERLLVTQQDLIAYHSPAYFPSAAAWQEYRVLTRLGLRTADRVLFFSAHAREDALGEELVEPARASVVHLGVDHPVTNTEPAAPAGSERLSETPVLFCLGTDFLHKNRVFALRLLQALREQGVEATLVLAGPRVAHGSSQPHEERFVQSHPHLAPAVLDLGPVTEAEKHWLYTRADLVIYPTVLEGFGLVPFEAAAHRVPCLWAPGSALSELLPDEAAGIAPWDANSSAKHARALLQDHQARERNLAAIETAAGSLTWDATAHQLLDVYRATAEAPARPRGGTGLTLTEDAARLVGPGGELP
ncbi:MAG TPA: glycosyltransferase, partial [Solirubrobacteraceae bacterium]|nr:glycosyltransferase [Solirubrobacteraceae bacterium]